ncbi:MAG: MerR family transcriptional regulator [Pseudomonadota bacterium]
MESLLRIGEFAALMRVSVKALRFYGAEGLLTPSFTDPDTGYRYYSLEQCADVALISNLRSAGFSISSIAELLERRRLGKEFVSLFAAQRNKLDRERHELEERLDILETLTRSLAAPGDDAFSAVRLKKAREQRVYSRKATVPELGAPVTALFEAAESTVAGFGARAAAEAPFLLFHDSDGKRPPRETGGLSIEVCIPVTETAGGDLPGTTVIGGCNSGCSVIYSGDYAKTSELHVEMLDWAAAAGLRASGPLREIYHRFGADQDDYELPAAVLASRQEDFITELFLPVSA